jgi:peptide/nickel transport system substrate-binding protein
MKDKKEDYNMKFYKRFSVWLFIAVIAVIVTACSNNASNDKNGSSVGEKTTENNENKENIQDKEKIVNVGVTDTFRSVNPLLQDGTEVVKYATSLVFLPLVELNQDLEFEGQLASSITTEDNKNFIIKLKDNITWSDGQPITSKDVLYTFLCWASPEIGSTGMSIEKIAGTGEDGYVEPGAKEISGVIALDEKTVQITTKFEMALYSFQNIFGRYILILPEHILGDIPMDDLLTHEWFNAPSVVSGPYFIKDFDLNHYVHFEANENYYLGAPKIKKLNFNVVTASQLLTGLRSGEIDLVQQTMGAILQEDYDTIRELENITVFDGTPITNQSIFINTERIPEIKVRQALLYGIDRQTIFQDILKGKGEVVDGFLASAGPFYDESLTPTVYDPDKAAALLDEAAAEGWDRTTQYTFYVNSGDTTFVQIASFIAAQLAEIGINLQVNTVDISTLLSVAGNGEFDIMAVQYTYAPVDPYTDISWLLSKGGWTRYDRKEVSEALAKTQITSDVEEIKKQYLIVDTYVQQEVPMISAYIISALGAKNNRLQNAVPDVYGTFLNVHEWDIAN